MMCGPTASGVLWILTCAGNPALRVAAADLVATVEEGPNTPLSTATMNGPTVGTWHGPIVRDGDRNVRSPVVYVKVTPHILPTTATIDGPTATSSAIQVMQNIVGGLVEHAKIECNS